MPDMLSFGITLFSYLQQYIFSGKVETIPYSQFKQSIGQGIVANLTVGPENISGTVTGSSDQEFVTVRVNDPDLVKELVERKASYTGRHENRFLSSLLSWILPLGIFFLVLTRSELIDRLAVLLGGRVAEELVFNEISTGPRTTCSGPRTWPGPWSRNMA